jgi:threonine/homoserine/homoserine lactone efflux protein
MHAGFYVAFVLATTILMLIPGPNVALIVANSVAHGPRYGLLTVAGTSSAMVIQLALTDLGTHPNGHRRHPSLSPVRSSVLIPGAF